MPYKRFYRKKRSYTKRKRYGWKKRKSNAAARKGKKVYYFTRLSLNYSIIADNANTVEDSLVFSLGAVPGYQEYVDMFDEYKISAVKVKFFSPGVTTISNNTPSSTAAQFATPLYYTAIDYNDNALVVLGDLRQYQTCRVHTPNKMIQTRYLKPCFATQIFETGVTTGYKTGRGWLNTEDYQIPHYGLKLAIEETGGTLDFRYELKYEIKYYLAFRNSK